MFSIEFYSNTTLVKVKLMALDKLDAFHTHSNTTLVKVKFFTKQSSIRKQVNSNTTLVKVKFLITSSVVFCIAIQIQHLLKLNVIK